MNLSKKLYERSLEGHLPEDREMGLRIYDVGIDANDYKPVSLEQIAELMKLERRK